jgi:competence protein ComEC
LRLIFLSGLWLAGIYFGYKVNLPPLFGLLALAPLVYLLFNRKYLKRVIVISLGIFFFIAASIYTYHGLYHVDERQVRFYNDAGTVELKGMIAAAPDVRDKSTRLIIAVDEIVIGGKAQKAGGKVLAVTGRYPEYQYGDVLTLTGEMVTPTAIGDFDYRGYLAHQGIYSTMSYPHIGVIEVGRGFKPLAWLYGLRERMSKVLANVLPEPHGALAQGILLGIRSNIPAGLSQDFANSGTSHLLAISGMNIGIMAGMMLGVGTWLFGRRRYLYVWLALVTIWFYAVITGWNPPVVRGAFMASLFLAAEGFGRQKSGAAALLLAAAVMVGINPYLLADASFQLSFLAMAGLIFIYPVLRDYGRKVVLNGMGEAGAGVSLANMAVDTMSAALGAIIAVWPLIAYYFGLFSLAGPLATFLMAPALTAVTLLGSLTAVVGLASLTAAQFFGWLTWPFLSYMIIAAHWLGSPSIASVKVAWINPAFIIVYYLVFAAAVYLRGKWSRARSLAAGSAGLMQGTFDLPSGTMDKVKWLLIPLAVIAVLVVCAAVNIPGDELKVSFLDVGQGDAILIQKGNRQILIDGGPSPQAITLALSNKMPYWDRTIDLVILSHPHQYHLAGLVEVLRRYRIGQIMYPEEESTSRLYEEWLNLVSDAGVKSMTARAGQRIELGDGVYLEILNPSSIESDVHDSSVVVMLYDGKVSFLLTGDITGKAELKMMYRRAGLNAAVLKVAHHGSDTATTDTFLTAVNPRAAVISVGQDNDFGLPANDTVTRLKEKVGEANVYLTSCSGTISFITDGEKLWVETEK